jgi:UDP:flavonoid glycosyltransferase YjiC (YdhE family)
MSRFVLATSGTHGDLNPYLAVAVGLQERGHRVTLAACPCYQSKVESEGVRFQRLRPDFAELMNSSPEIAARVNNLRTGTEYLMKELFLPKLRETYDDLMEACEGGADLLVIHPVLFPAPLVAEKLRLKWVSVILSPGLLLSAYDPPLMPPLAWFYPMRHFGSTPHRLLFQWIFRFTRSWMQPVDDLRKQIGLPPSSQHPANDGMFSPLGTLGWFSPVIGPRQPDWPAYTEVTGFVYDGKGITGEMDPALLDFLEHGEPPIAFTLGTNAVNVAGDFYRVSLEAIRRGGWRAVILTGKNSLNQISPNGLPSSVFVAPYAPFSELFPRAAAVVNSGGIGTIGEGLRAGVPMLVVPHSGDQPDNAVRAARLGAARVLRREQYQPERVAKELRGLLEERGYSIQAKKLAEEIKEEDGVARACDALERHAKD